MRRALAFRSGARSADYGASFSRLRWRRAVSPDRVIFWSSDEPAITAVAGADMSTGPWVWIVVLEESALPIADTLPEPAPGTVLVAEPADVSQPVHTLRELDAARPASSAASEPGRPDPAALTFRSEDFPPAGGETVDGFLRRLAGSASVRRGPGFRVLRFEDPSEHERPELTRRLPAGTLRILDVGCGAGGAIASARERNPGWDVTGVEKDAALAERARARGGRVLAGDLAEVLPRLAAAGERFDAIVLADVVEHVEDPVSALRAARELAAPGSVLVVSVPNAGHLSLVRDLVAGRWDPVPAGLCDAGHLRWFTRSSLRDALEEAGWRVESVEGERGAAAPDAEAFLRTAASWPGADVESLGTYQWIAVGRPE